MEDLFNFFIKEIVKELVKKLISYTIKEIKRIKKERSDKRSK